MRRAARGTVGLVAIVLGLSACEEAGQKIGVPASYEGASEAACRVKGGAPTIKAPTRKASLPDPTQSADSSGPPNRPTWVDLKLVPDVTAINELDDSFEITGLMTLVWCDPRLQDTVPPAQDKIYLDQQAEEQLGDIWRPDLAFVNGRSAVNVQTETLRIYSNGTVKYEQRFDVLLQADYDLKKFPFDHHTLRIEIQSFTWPESDLSLLKKVPSVVQISVPAGWQERTEDGVFVFRNDVAELTADLYFTDAADASRRDSLKIALDALEKGPPTFSHVTMGIGIAREAGFYYTKLIVPLVLIVGMSWTVFWVKPEDLNDRMALTFTAILTIVAFQFLISDQLPRVSYQTFMDRLLLTSFGFMICTGVESVAVNILVGDGRATLAATVDRNSRWAFPLVYVAVLGVISAATLWPV